ncbi:hypothetical protein SBA2_270001 [Acidobacteriia bacterium SbA2]|nr:hypothetical protein SBA2_270001 [Acidobacteriia bacterium SbA2]
MPAVNPRSLKAPELSWSDERRTRKEAWFSQTSTREKKLAGEMPRLGINGRTAVGGSSAYPRSVPLGCIDELGLSPGRRERQSTGL